MTDMVPVDGSRFARKDKSDVLRFLSGFALAFVSHGQRMVER